MALGQQHSWMYRGQVIPSNEIVTVEASIEAVDDEERCIRGSGWLMVDGRVIYKMSDFALRAVPRR